MSMSPFTRQSFNFLNELSVNNEREWFKANQARYEDNVRTPALKFIEAMQPHITALSPRLTAVPKKVGGSMMRPQRDSRFSKDKMPYKTNVGIQFRHFQGKDVHAPGLYLHIANDGCFLGAGIWHPESKALNAIRTCIDENPNSYKKALRELTAQGFEMQGSQLIRPPKGYDKAHPMLDELKRKDFIAIKPLTIEQVYSADFVELCAQEFAACQQLMRYLCFALDLDY
ncbi:TIGR02453 family protein [Shewanella sairae]|uniref:TIGR02453 family protein n=2 Tax=Shewanella sairae TaxID=190310 RepID=A0ABQ4PHW4_9GAMM|nr:TIGR02453 family protein [Shewanella sairae]